MIQIIGEIGLNSNGDMEIAKQLIDKAVEAGFTHVKWQKRNPDKCVPEEQKKVMKDTPWGRMTYIDYKYKMEFDKEQYKELFSYAYAKKIIPFASVWDLDSMEFMMKLTDIVKVPSALITDGELVSACRYNFKTMMISTGMSTEHEVQTAMFLGDPDVVFHTNSAYPSPVEELNLNYILTLRKRYPLIDLGYSAHEFGLATTFATVPMGVKWIERHITLDRNMWGSDQLSSVEPLAWSNSSRESGTLRKRWVRESRK